MEITPVNILFLSLGEAAVTFCLVPYVLPNGNLVNFIAIFLSLNLSVYIFYHLVIYPFFLSPLRHLPHPPTRGWPIIGHGMKMFQRPSGAAHLELIKDVTNNGLICWRGFFHAERLLVTTPAAIADVLVHNSYDYEKPPWTRNFLRIFLGDGLLVTEGDEHRHQRKHIMPAFHFRHIKDLYPFFWLKSMELCTCIKTVLQEKPSSVIDIGHFSTQVAMDIIGLAGLGRDIGSLRNNDDELIKNYEEILQPTFERFAYFTLHLLLPRRVIRVLPWKVNESVERTTSNLKRICTDFVVEKKTRTKIESQESVDILSIMLRSNVFSDDTLVDQLLTFLAAGHETTSSALTWATHLLATHPEIQSRLRAEIHENIPEPKALSDPSFDIPGLLESLPYLNAVCKEVLRLYPTLPLSARYAVRDTAITGHFVPKGSLVFVVPWATNRDTKLWGPDAEAFRPERWLDTPNGGADSNYAFLTFFHGPRSCIGQTFARAELRVLVAAFVGEFVMHMADPQEKIRVGGTITSKPIDGMRLKLTRAVRESV